MDETLRLPTTHGPIFVRHWHPTGPLSGQIAVVHGMGEHSGRYQHVAKRLTQAGYGVLALDQHGHGENSGRRGHVDRFEWLLDSLDTAIDHLRQRDPGVPLFLYGHSLGGGVVLNHALRRPSPIAGVIASSPLLRTTTPPPAWKVRVGKLLSRVWPTFMFATGIDPAARSHDPQVALDYAADPLTHSHVSARLAVEMLQAGRWALESANTLTVPTLVLHGDADPITCHAASGEFAASAGDVCELQLWSGKLHELHWETNRDEVLDQITAWLDQHTRQAP